MENNSRIPILKGKPFFEQLKLSINFIDSNMKLIDNSVRTSNTDEEYNYVKKVIDKVNKYNDDVNAIARCLKVNNCLKRNAMEFDDEVQNLKEILRCKEIDCQLEPFKYAQQSNLQTAIQQTGLQAGSVKQQVHTTQIIQKPNNFTSQERRLKLLTKNNLSEDLNLYNNGLKKSTNFESSTNYLINRNTNQTVNLNSVQKLNNLNSLIGKNSSLKKKDTFILKEHQADDNRIKKPTLSNFIQAKREQLKENQADLTNESIDRSNQFSFDFKLPYNKLKNNYFPSNSNYSVDESLEIEFTPGLKSRRTCKKNPYFNESNASTQELQSIDKQVLQLDNSIKQDSLLIKNEMTDRNQSIKQETFCSKTDSNKPDSNEGTEFNKRPMTYESQDLSIKQEQKRDVVSPPRNIDKFEEKIRPHKLSTPKKPPNFDFMF